MGSCSWLCPLCDTPLSIDHKRWFCAANHSFDIAKEGYVNLLPAQNKKSRSPGDSKEMIRSRRTFLNQGFFVRLADSVSHTIKELRAAQSEDSSFNLLDCGCGEGYYTAQIYSYIPQHINLFGLDISKPAVQMASKTHKDIHFAVASAFSIPLPDQSLHVALQIFSPSADDHIRQKLRPEGTLIRVTPGENHLRELRDSIYKNTNEHLVRPPAETLFTLAHREKCEFTMQLNNSHDIANLLMMTPHFWKAPPQLKETLRTKDSMELSADFVISSYTKAKS